MVVWILFSHPVTRLLPHLSPLAPAPLPQEAAGCFALLRDRDAPRVDPPRPVDVSPECCTMLEKLMLAQAQECFFEKATKDNKSPGIVAR